MGTISIDIVSYRTESSSQYSGYLQTESSEPSTSEILIFHLQNSLYSSEVLKPKNGGYVWQT